MHPIRRALTESRFWGLPSPCSVLGRGFERYGRFINRFPYFELNSCRDKGWPEGSILEAVSLGHLHAYQMISEVEATSTAPKNK